MINELAKLANDLDSRGLVKEADLIDGIIKAAHNEEWNPLGDAASGEPKKYHMTDGQVASISEGFMDDETKEILGIPPYERAMGEENLPDIEKVWAEAHRLGAKKNTMMLDEDILSTLGIPPYERAMGEEEPEISHEELFSIIRTLADAPDKKAPPSFEADTSNPFLDGILEKSDD